MQRHTLACRYGIFRRVVLSPGHCAHHQGGAGDQCHLQSGLCHDLCGPGRPGTFTLVNLAALGAQILLLRREFRPIQFQLPATVIFSAGLMSGPT